MSGAKGPAIKPPCFLPVAFAGVACARHGGVERQVKRARATTSSAQKIMMRGVTAVTTSIFGNNFGLKHKIGCYLLPRRSPSGSCTGHMHNVQRKRQLLAAHEERRRAPKQRWPAGPCCTASLCHWVQGPDSPPAFVTVMPAREQKTGISAMHTTADPEARTST